MNITIGNAGRSFVGAGRYYFRDAPYRDDDGKRVEPTTSERVAWTVTRNLVNDDPETAMREMWKTADDQEFLQTQAGGRPHGCKKPVLTIALSWKPGDEPSKEEMIAAADDYLVHMGWEKHQAVYVAHNEKEHRHVHIILNKVNPETGKTLDDFQSKIRSQPWALAYEIAHGDIQSPKRLEQDYATKRRPKSSESIPNGLDKEGRAQEQPYVEATEALARNDRADRDLLAKRQQEQREAFFAAAKPEFRAARQQAFHNVKDAYHQAWKEHFETAKLLRRQARLLSEWNATRASGHAGEGRFDEARQALAGADVEGGFDPVKLVEERIAEARQALNAEQKAERERRQEMACRSLYQERNERFQSLKDQQREERAELRTLLAADQAGKPIDIERVHYLLHGERKVPTDPNALMAQLATANDRGELKDLPRPSNDNRAPQVAAVGNDPFAEVTRFREPIILPPQPSPAQQTALTQGLTDLLMPGSPFQQMFAEAHERRAQALEQDGEARARARDEQRTALLWTRTGSMDNVQMDALGKLQRRAERIARIDREAPILSATQKSARDDTEAEQ